jgi:CRISPR-associated protein Cmr6
MNANTGSPPQRQYAVPQATARLVEQFGARCQNLGLLLDKFVPEEAIGESKLQAAWFKERLLPNQRQNAPLWEARYQRWLALTQAASALTFQAKLAGRMVVGLGERTVLETGLTLDHLTGLPIIPGSALKGLTRAWAVREHFNSDSTKTEDDPPEIKDLFGAPEEQEQDHAGKVVFFDAFPIPPGLASGKPRFVVDIMNPHYPKYYQDSTQGQNPSPPSNDQSPIPVFFLTVSGASFQFALAPRAGVTEVDVEKVVGWLQLALQEYGVGGKTSAGYGVFDALPAQSQPQAPEPAVASQQPTMTREEALARLGGKKRLDGTVQQRIEAGAIIKLRDTKVGLRGLIPQDLSGGRALLPGNSTPMCEVQDVTERDGEWFVVLKCPPK